MKKQIRALAAALVFIYGTANCSVVEIPLQQRAAASALVVEGQVTAKESYWDINHTMIYTAHTIEVYKVFKGTITPSLVQVLTPGGIVGMDRITVEPSLELQVGDVGVFTCENVTRIHPVHTQRNALPQFEAYAAVQGFVRYNLETETAGDAFRQYTDIENQVYAVVQQSGARGYREVRPFSLHSSTRSNQPPVSIASISGFSPTTVAAGTGTTITITGTGFGATQGSGFVSFPNADDGGSSFISPLPSQYVSWSNTQIVVEVPSEAGTGNVRVTQGVTFVSPGTLTVSYAHLNVQFDPGPGTIAYETDHIDDNGSGGYTWRMNTGFDSDAAARASFMRAFDTWRCNTNVNWTIGATTSVNDAVSDGTNVICYDNTAPLPAGVLGVCYSYWSGCASGPNIVWYVNELDIIFDEGSNITPLTWEFGPATPSGSEYDFETVAVHELGHGHQLGHVIAPGAIMHFAISNGTSNRSLGVDDLAGGNYVQAKSIVANLCGPGAMTNHSCASPPVAAFSGTPLTVCAGETVAFTDLSTNTPTSWAWTFTGGTPSASSSQNPTITYNTPGVYDVTLVATNASGSDPITMTAYITVNALPVVGTSASPATTVCNGTSVTLSGTGAAGYVWTGGVTDGVPFSATASATYTVTGTDANGCDATDVISITVNNLPNVVAGASPSATLCGSGTVTLSGSGATSYVWTGGVSDGVPFLAAATTTYTVTGTDGNGCSNTDVITVTVNTPPTVTANASPATTVCNGTQLTLSGSGANSYVWTGGVSDGVPFTATASNTYTVTGTDGNGCTGTDVISITVNNCSSSTLPCGNTYYNMVSQASATQVPGAVSYRFTFYDNVTLVQVAQRTQSSRTLTFSNVAGLYYNTTYRWTVAVDAGSGFGPESSNACTVIFGQPNPTVPCGLSFSTGLNSSASASNATGIVGYRFTFYDNVTGVQVAQRSQASRTLIFGTVPGLYNNMTYRWSVAIEYALSGGGTAFGPESNNNCTVTFSVPQTTLPCGNTYPALNSSVTVPSVYGAVNYRYTFYDNVTGVQVAQRTQTSNVLTMSNVSGIFAGNTYRWSVAVEYNVSSGGTAFGPESNTLCTVTIAAPVTVVPCGGTYNYATGNASATAKFGATGYRFRFYQGVTLMGQRAQVSRTLYFNQVPGLANNQAYTWTVEVEYNNGTGLVFGPPSTACPVTLGVPPTPSHNPEEQEVAAAEPALLTLQVYPNPTRDKFTIVTNEPVDAVYIYTITGTLVKTDTRVTEVDLSAFNTGTYLVVVQTASGVQRTRVVKE